MNGNERVSLRPVTDDDRELLLRVYEASRETELAMVQWESLLKRTFVEHQFDAQDRHYREHYPGATFDVILFEGEPAGRLCVYRGESQFAIMDITVLPEYRRRGIASHLISAIIDEAKANGRSIRIFLEPFNPHQAFFSNLGFKVSDDDGVTRRYEWHPDKPE